MSHFLHVLSKNYKFPTPHPDGMGWLTDLPISCGATHQGSPESFAGLKAMLPEAIETPVGYTFPIDKLLGLGYSPITM